jgi:hypothetical protein
MRGVFRGEFRGGIETMRGGFRGGIESMRGEFRGGIDGMRGGLGAFTGDIGREYINSIQ